MASFRDVDPELMQFMQRFGGPQMGLDQPGGILTGPKATWFAGKTGGLGRFLDKIKQRIHVSEAETLPYGYDLPTVHGITVSPGTAAGGKIGSSDIMFPAGRPESLRKELAPFHEGLHGAYNATGREGFPPREHWPTLIEKIRQMYPDRVGRIDEVLAQGGNTPGEVIIDWLARNILRNQGFQSLGP